MKTEIRIILLVLAAVLMLLLDYCRKSDVITEDEPWLIREADSIVFAVIGDFGLAGNNEKRVADMVKAWNPDFIITTGDNNYPSGELSDYIPNVSDYYGDYIYNYDAPEAYRCKGKAFYDSINRFFPTPGNHDIGNPVLTSPYYDYFSLPGNESFYAFRWGPVSFFSVNSNLADMEIQKEWLSRQTLNAESPFRIAFFHHPPFSPGPHGNTFKMQWDFIEYGMDAVFSGHDHLYARVVKNNGEGLNYFINGAGGRNLYECDSLALSEDEFTVSCFDEDFGAMKCMAGKDVLIVEFWTPGTDIPVERTLISKKPGR